MDDLEVVDISTAELLKKSAHLTDKLVSGTATPHDKANMPAVYDELENRQTEDKKISGGMLPTAELLKKYQPLMGKLESGQATSRDKEKLKSVQDALEKQSAEDKAIPGLATAELKARNAALMGKLESGQATPREKEKLKTVQHALEQQQAEDKAIASGLATAELKKRCAALMGTLESGQATPREKEKLQTVMSSIEQQKAEDKAISSGLATAELMKRSSALMGKLESGQATPRDKQKLQAVQDALEKQKAEDQTVPGLATAELKKRGAALLGKLESGQATPRDKQKLQAVQDALEQQKAEDKAISSGLATAELMKRSAALMGSLTSGQATPREKEQLQTVNDALEKQQAEDKTLPGLETAELIKRSAALAEKAKTGTATQREKEKLKLIQEAHAHAQAQLDAERSAEVTRQLETKKKELLLTFRNTQIKGVMKDLAASEKTDLVFLVDKSQSQQAQIDAVKSQVLKISENVKRTNPSTQLRVAVVAYCDPLDGGVGIGDGGNYTKYAGTSLIAEPARLDKFGNAEGNEYDLGVDGSFAGSTVGVLHFYTGEGFDFSLPEAALTEKGFAVKRWTAPPSPEALKEALYGCTQLWIISDQARKLTDEHLKVIKEFYERGNGVAIWGDNEPFYADANAAAGYLFPGVSMHGNTHGDQTVPLVGGDATASMRGKAGFREHMITTGIQNLYEGITIATVNLPGDAASDNLFHLVNGSAGNPVTAIHDGENRAVIDGGFTRLYCKWDTAGSARFVKNLACWLDNRERKVAMNANVKIAFTDDLKKLEAKVGTIKATGGGDECEDVASGLRDVLSLDWKSPTRLLFHITDAPTHGDRYHDGAEDNHPTGDHGIPSMLRKLKEQGVEYIFARMNGSTDKMIAVFNKDVGGETPFVRTVPMDKPHLLTDTATKSLRGAMSSTFARSSSRRTPTRSSQLHALMPELAEEEDQTEREFRILSDLPDWGSLPKKPAGVYRNEPLVDIKGLKKQGALKWAMATASSWMPSWLGGGRGLDGGGSSSKAVKMLCQVGAEPFATGNVRLARHGRLQYGDGGVWEDVVLKDFKKKNAVHHAKEKYMSEMEVATIAAALAAEFNKQLKPPVDKQIRYVQSPVIEVAATETQGTRYYFAEEKLDGEFIKFCNNTGSWNPDHLDEWLMRFVLWTQEVTGGFMMVADLQGIKTPKGYVFTDPVVLCKDIMRFGSTNMGPLLMEKVANSARVHMDELKPQAPTQAWS